MIDAPAKALSQFEGVVLTEGDALPPPPPPESGMVQEVVYPKLYMNGFPKSGLHLSVLMAMCLVEGPAHENPWSGTYAKRGWSRDWMPDWRIYKHLSRLKSNSYLKGHSGFRDDINMFLWQMGASVAFVYRDLRDVAVSMSYHVISDDDKHFSHDDKHLFQSLPTHEDVLEACICGIGSYPGLVERWEEYAPWLEQQWVFRLPYEDMRLKPHSTARRFIEYVFHRTGDANGIKIDMPEKAYIGAVSGMVQAMGITQASPTFRKGVVGGWVDHFSPRIKDAFVDTGGGRWLVELGYEDGNDW